MEIDLSQFHQVFFEESYEGLDNMEQQLLGLEDDADLETINSIFRVAHSIKGGSATFNFKEVAEFTHILETLLDQMRDGLRAVSKEIVDLLLKSVDCLKGMLNRIEAGESVGDSHLQLVEHFNHLLDENASTNTSDEPQSSVQDAQQDAPDRCSLWKIKFIPKPHILETGNEPLRMFRELETLGYVTIHSHLDAVPEFSQLTPESCFIYWDILLEADEISESDIQEIFEWIEHDCELIIEKQNQPSQHLAETSNHANSSDQQNTTEESAIAEQKKLVPVEQAAEKKITKASSASSIRVGTDKVDTLIDLVGELVITQSMLGELTANFDLSKLNQLISGISELEHNTRELQESVMRIRMLPIGFVFNRLPRMVRDLSSKLGKKVNLIVRGESTELDKTVMEQVGDPLTHLVRNALDHGIETIEKRLTSGKQEEGTLIINAFHQGGNIVVEVADDGGGIDPDVIFNKAVEKGLIRENAELSKEQILALILEPGFSTAEVVSDVSGRGVGMDVVRRNINNLGGSVEINSELGEGTTFTIRLPLTLAILDGQLIRVAGEIYVLPLVSIVESVPLSSAVIAKIAGEMPVYKLHDDYIPIIDLKKEFAIAGDSTAKANEGLLAIVDGENEKIALLIDELLGQQQVVIKSLESHYKSIQGVSGATILGDGRVSLILDIVGLSKRSKTPIKKVIGDTAVNPAVVSNKVA